jgi:hypothetical protein
MPSDIRRQTNLSNGKERVKINESSRLFFHDLRKKITRWHVTGGYGGAVDLVRNITATAAKTHFAPGVMALLRVDRQIGAHVPGSRWIRTRAWQAFGATMGDAPATGRGFLAGCAQYKSLPPAVANGSRL